VCCSFLCLLLRLDVECVAFFPVSAADCRRCRLLPSLLPYLLLLLPQGRRADNAAASEW
jgi:hypothetical protein